ncbi:hypothetical protein [Winogradskyella wichelsiae]|uniref:hypothetical protein n=1 Tax=Winogradskyella wichelsiae TaxID=2697007 RepID=UPI003EF73781
MKTKTITTKFILFTFLFSILFSCQTEDLNSELELQNSEVKFAIDDSGKILENIPPEILILMVQEFEISGEKNKIDMLKNTYDLGTGDLTKLAINSETYLVKQNEYLNEKSLSRSGNYNGYRAHVAGLGWLPWTSYGEIIGTTGQDRQLEAIEFNSIPSPLYAIGQAHVSGIGWYNQGSSRVLGTIGQGRRMEAIRLFVARYYRVHVAGLGWLPWVSQGQVAGTIGQERRMEAFQLFNFLY